MYKVIIGNHILEKIRTYVDILLGGYLLRFYDTGMGEAEVIIRNNYIESADFLADTIYDTLETRMRGEIVLYSLEQSMRKHLFAWEHDLYQYRTRKIL